MLPGPLPEQYYYYYYVIKFNVRIEPLRLITHVFVSLVVSLRSTFILALHVQGQGFRDAAGCSTSGAVLIIICNLPAYDWMGDDRLKVTLEVNSVFPPKK